MNRNGGLRSRLRDRINRLRRKTKGYGKSLGGARRLQSLVCLKLRLFQYQHTLRIPSFP